MQCGESKAAVKESQRKGGQNQLYCATVDYWGECDADWERHKFTWTKKDQAAQEAHDTHWARLADEIQKREAEEQAAPEQELAADYLRNEHG